MATVELTAENFETVIAGADLALQVAVIGARMLDWPVTRLERE